jgi:hypothetical protein
MIKSIEPANYNKNDKQKNVTLSEVSKYNRKIVERGKIDTH